MTTILAPKERRELVAERVKRFILECLPGKALDITIAAHKSERTGPQNRYLNGVAYKLISDATGFERDDVSEFCLGSFFGWVTVKCPKTPSNPNGVKDVPRRTTTKNEKGERDVLKWDEFGDYVAWIQRFAARKGIIIPDADPEWFKHETEQEAA